MTLMTAEKATTHPAIYTPNHIYQNARIISFHIQMAGLSLLDDPGIGVFKSFLKPKGTQSTNFEMTGQEKVFDLHQHAKVILLCQLCFHWMQKIPQLCKQMILATTEKAPTHTAIYTPNHIYQNARIISFHIQIIRWPA